MPCSRLLYCLAILIALGPQGGLFSQQPDQPISFRNDVRPLLAAKCFGCHQPAQPRGGYVITDFDQMLAGGDSDDPAVIAGDAAGSRLVELVTPHEGQAEMPPDAPPLSKKEVQLIRDWINQGAKNDFSVESNFSPKNPPRYSHLPNISSLDISGDGKLIALSGFHEVIVIEVASPFDSRPKSNARIVQRFIGLSSRIEAVQFSPDDDKLAVSGGVPGEFGEIQIWSVDDGELLLSKVVSHDTVYGVSWSPDGTKLAFGCSDTTLRAIDSLTGEQILYQSAHDDWVRDSVFSKDGSQIVSVGRDMSCKLVDVETQRFIDNITSITPGVLKGGIASVVRHPERNEVVIGGADGIPKIYRMNRVTKRVIGDDANLIRRFPKMDGRIQAVAVSNDGLQLAAGSSIDGEGSVQVFGYPRDTELTDELKKILVKTVGQQSPAEKQKLEEFVTTGVDLISSIQIPESGIYTLDFHPDGKWLAAAGRDGMVRLIETKSGKLLVEIQPISLDAAEKNVVDQSGWHFNSHSGNHGMLHQADSSRSAKRLVVSPRQIEFRLPIDYVQLVVQAEMQDGSLQDVTDQIALTYDQSVIKATDQMLQVVGNGQTELKINWKGIVETIPVNVALEQSVFEPDFKRDVNPVLTKLGCNAGTCHGSQGGKKGFKLSLRGYDPIFDIRALTDDLASRRVSFASPDSSLMLLKPTAQVAHEGGLVMEKDSRYFNLVKEWIRNGGRLNPDTSKVRSIEIFPKNPILPSAGDSQQVRVVATYDNGVQRDVTREAVIETGNLDVATAIESKIRAVRRGESPVLARYDGAFAAVTLTVMGDRQGFVWKEPEMWGSVDELVAAKWKRMKIVPSPLCTDAEFIRRVYLDLTGLPPTAVQVQEFLDDQRPTQDKRDALIDELVGNESFVHHWSNKWADLLQVNRKYLGAEGAQGFREWIHEQVNSNRPYDEFAYDILTAAGSNRENPAASYYKIHRTPADVMENTTHLFLATRFNCNKCHDHPFERWTQDQYYETAAFFAKIDRKKDPASGDKKIDGTAVEDSRPLYEIISDVEQGEISHERTGAVVNPTFPFTSEYDSENQAADRVRLAAWLTSADNPYFATSYVNRLWGYMTGTGLIEPLDDIRAGNPPTNPDLLEYLRDEFIESGFDTQHMLKLICKSRTYQLSIETNELNADDELNYSHAKARRLPAEVLFDSVHFVTGAQLAIPGVEPGTRAAALPDSGVTLPSGLLATLGRPARESSCECERVNDVQLGSVLALTSGPDLSKAINDPENELANLVKTVDDDRELIDSIVLRILNRRARVDEIEIGLKALSALEMDHQLLIEMRDERLQDFEQRLPDLERNREIAIEKITAQLSETVAELDPELAQREAKHANELAAAKKQLDDYQKQADVFTNWKKHMLRDLQWHPLVFSQVETVSQRGFSLQDDRSIVFEKKPGNDIYTLSAGSNLSGISAVRLELMPDDSLAAQGPGLAENGNLVLTEFQMQIAHPDTPDQWHDVEISSVLANISQEHYPIANSIDGQVEGQGGWAIGNNIGQISWATYQLKLPVGYSSGSLLRFKLFQDYDDRHQIGRLRISVSSHDQPAGLGLSEALLAQLGSPEKDWSEEVKKKLQTAFEKGDAKLIKLRELVANKQKPLDIAPEIVKLREQLERVSQPVQRDAVLVQLEHDAVLSEKQLKNRRLTAAQDFAWALINSPSFLFNR